MMDTTIVRIRDDENGLKRFGLLDDKNELMAALELELGGGMASVRHIYVRPEARRRGAGTKLLQSVLNIIGDMDIFMPVEMLFATEEENGRALFDFLSAQENMIIRESSMLFSITPEMRGRSKAWQQMKAEHSDALEFFFLDEEKRRAFFEKLKAEGKASYIQKNGTIYDRNLSFAMLKDDGVCGALFVKAFGHEVLEISYLYSDGRDMRTAHSLLCAAIKAADELYPEAELRFVAVNPEIYSLARKVFGNELRLRPLYRAVWNGVSEKMKKDAEAVKTSF